MNRQRPIPWWSRLYLTIPRHWIVRVAHRYVRAKSVLGGPRRARLRLSRLRPYADLMGVPVENLETKRLVERTVEQLDDLLVNRPAYPLAPPLRIEEAEYLTGAVAAGRGVIIGFEHTTHRKVLLAAVHSLVGPNMRLILPATRRRRPARTTRKSVRRRFVAQVDRSGDRQSTRHAREAFRLLAAGHVVIIATDGRAGKQLPVPFLGTTVNRPTGPARLSYRTGAPIVMVLPRMASSGRIVVAFCPPIFARQDLPEAEAVADAMLRVAVVAEPYLRRRPWIAGVRFVRLLFREARGGAVRTASTTPGS